MTEVHQSTEHTHHTHDSDEHGHSHEHHDHEHPHEHHHDHEHGGILVMIAQALHLPGYAHEHASLAQDAAFQDNELGIRVVKLALLALGVTTLIQIVIYVASGSVALLADTVH